MRCRPSRTLSACLRAQVSDVERYEAYKDSGVEWIGEVPEGWGVTRFNNACSSSLGKMLTNVPSTGSSYLGCYLKAANVQEGGFSLDAVSEMYFDPGDEERYGITAGDLLVVEGGSVGLAHVWTGILAPCYIQNALHRVRPFECFSVEFLKYSLDLARYAGYIDLVCNKATIAHFTKEKLLATPLVAPSFAEQHAIADYLDTKTAEIDALVADCEREVGLLQEYRKAVISEVVTKGLDPDAPMKDSGIEWIGEIPASWDIVRFKAIGTVVANLQHPTDYPDFPQVSPDRIEKDSGRLLPCISVAEVGVESDNHLFHIGDILYSKVRPALNKVTIAPFDGMCSADMYPIESSQNSRWLVFYMLSNAFMEQVVVSTDRVKMPKVNKEELGAFKVVLPSQDAQSEIVAYLDAKTAEIDSLIEAKQSMADKLREYRRSLISEAVTGKFKVPGA